MILQILYLTVTTKLILRRKILLYNKTSLPVVGSYIIYTTIYYYTQYSDLCI